MRAPVWIHQHIRAHLLLPSDNRSQRNTLFLLQQFPEFIIEFVHSLILTQLKRAVVRKPKGDRKGPHPSTSSTPASTKNGLERRIVVIVEAGDEGRPGGDPCGRLSVSPPTSNIFYEAACCVWLPHVTSPAFAQTPGSYRRRP